LVELETVDIPDAADLASAFMSLRAGGAEAVNVLSSPMLFAARAGNRAEIEGMCELLHTGDAFILLPSRYRPSRIEKLSFVSRQ